jgi:dihydrofolate reductase
MIKASVYIATSLDGFIARPDGDIEWLTRPTEPPSDSDYGYQAFIDSVDVIVIGRNTFETMLTFDSWPYTTKKVVVLSRSLTQLPAHLPDSVLLRSVTPTELLAELAAAGAQHAYIDGGQIIQAFLNAGLINELILTRIPILIGTGIPLFGQVDRDIHLSHIATQAFINGFVQSRYQIRG